MVAAYMGTKELLTRVNNEVAHTIAVMTLLFYLVPLVLINGSMASFISAVVPFNEINKLRRELGHLKLLEIREDDLFPSLEFEGEWPSAARWTGMNSCWRPWRGFRSFCRL